MDTSITPRYHGFTCPDCGSHFFGTSKVPKGFFKDHPEATRVGHCHANAHTGNGCKFSWNRDDQEMEDKCIYNQTPEEWAASYEEGRP